MGNDTPKSFTPESAGDAARTDWTCLECDYSLAHTSEDRCPECGARFSPVNMAIIHAGKPTPSYPWDIENSESAWWGTVSMMVFEPGALQYRMSLSPDGDSAAAFSLFNHMLMPLFIAIGFLIVAASTEKSAGSGEMVCAAVLPVALWSVATFVYEMALAFFLAKTLKPRRRRASNAVWAVVIHYSSAYPTAIVLVNCVGGLLVLGVIGLNWFTSQALNLELRPVLGTTLIGLIAVASGSLGFMWALNIVSTVASLSRPSAVRPAVLTVLGFALVAGLALHALCFVPLTLILSFGIAPNWR